MKNIILSLLLVDITSVISQAETTVRERTSFNANWRFEMNDPVGYATSLVYDDLKSWILPSAMFVRQVIPAGDFTAMSGWSRPSRFMWANGEPI